MITYHNIYILSCTKFNLIMITVEVTHNGQTVQHTFNGCRCDAQKFVREVLKNELYDEIKITGKVDGNHTVVNNSNIKIIG